MANEAESGRYVALGNGEVGIRRTVVAKLRKGVVGAIEALATEGTTGEGSGEGGVAAGVAAPPTPAADAPVAQDKPVLKKAVRVTVYSVYPTYNIQLEKGEFEPRQDTKNRFYQHEVKKPSTIQFTNHRAYVSPEEAEKMRDMVDFWYGQDFILKDDLKAMLVSKNAEEKHAGREFCKRMHARGEGVLRRPVEYADLIEEMGVGA